MLDMTSLAGVDLNIARLPRHGRVISSDITWLWRGDRVVSGFILAYKVVINIILILLMTELYSDVRNPQTLVLSFWTYR